MSLEFRMESGSWRSGTLVVRPVRKPPESRVDIAVFLQLEARNLVKETGAERLVVTHDGVSVDFDGVVFRMRFPGDSRAGMAKARESGD